MTDTFVYGKRAKYPHMKPNDVAIWERFIEKWPDIYDYVQYDLELGYIPDFVKEHEDTSMQAQAPLYQRKIDVVGIKGENIDIIELKPNASMSTLGQVLGYTALYKRDFNPPKPLRAVIITDKTDPDTQHAAVLYNIKIIVV